MIAIIKYNSGNIRSVQNAISKLGYQSEVTDSADLILAAEKVIFPGVGKADSAMTYLRERGLDNIIREIKKPLLGICLGMQLLCRWSEEGDTECIGVFESDVKRFPDKLRVPHTGWNSLSHRSGPLFKETNSDDNYYFVHSYYVEQTDETAAICNYILPFSAVINKGNFYGTQFHPEKSGTEGSLILKNFLEL